MRKQTFNFKWAVNRFRADKRTGAVNPIKPSRYFKELAKKGAGF